LSYLFKSYTLLIVQILAILFGAFGAYKLALHFNLKRNASLVVLLSYLCNFTIFTSLSFDYHSNVVASMLLPWYFLFHYKGSSKLQWLFLFLILIAKENMGLWMAFVNIGLLLLNSKKQWKKLGVAALVSLVYSYIVIDHIMPINGGENKLALDYAVLGNSTSEAIKNIVSSPLEYLKYLWMDSRPGFERPSLYKREFWIYFLATGGILLLRKPALILMLIPVFLQKMLNVRTQIWGINDHYAIETLPIISLGIILFLKRFQDIEWKIKPAPIILFSTLLITVFTLTISAKGPKNEKGQFFTIAHYNSNFNRAEIRQALAQIPKEAKICATSNILAQVAYRDHAFRFPIHQNAEFILHIKGVNTYPLKPKEFEKKINTILETGSWQVIENKAVLILKKIEK
jgi:uncharacterized membrane protein